MKVFMKPPKFEMVEYTPVEYEAVEYEEEKIVTIDYEEFSKWVFPFLTMDSFFLLDMI